MLGICAINPGLQLSPPLPHKVEFDFDEPRESYEGWQKMNRHYWLEDWPDFAQFFFGEMFPEPHSTKQREDCVDWAMQTTPEAMILAGYSPRRTRGTSAETVAAAEAVRCPVLVITGSLDKCQNPQRSIRLAEITGGDHVDHRGRRASAAGARSGEGEPAAAGLRPAGLPVLTRGRNPPT